MNKQRGISIMELLLALVILLIAVPTIYTTIATSYRHSVVNRNRVAANLIARSFFEEVSAHHFGRPAPKSWPVPTIGALPTSSPNDWQALGAPAVEELMVFVENRQQQMKFLRQLALKNGSLIGKDASKGWDQVTLKITWKETQDVREKSATSSIVVWSQDAPKR